MTPGKQYPFVDDEFLNPSPAKCEDPRATQKVFEFQAGDTVRIAPIMLVGGTTY